MSFTSFHFLFFLLIVLSLYYFLDRKKQNWLLFIASYIFYGWWDWRFISLLFLSTTFAYFSGLWIDRAETDRKRWWIACFSNAVQLIVLIYFKYFNFFVDSLQPYAEQLGISAWMPAFKILVPVAISFYTFHTLSYTIDIQRKQALPTTDFIAFAVFISFFPQLVAGPIARASHLLPQTLTDRKPSYELFFEGAYFCVWGYFKKVMIADNLGVAVGKMLENPDQLTFGNALLTVYAFSFQIYCDFSGYSDIARGLSKMMGFELQLNFNKPYFSIDPSEFWQRWHISLSSWLRDYLYIPLGGNRGGAFRTYFNLSLTMLIGGIWHGANWTFVAWGAYHGLLLIAYRLFAPNIAKTAYPWWKSVLLRVAFFHLIGISWLLFRADNFKQAWAWLKGFTKFGSIDVSNFQKLVFVVPLLIVEFFEYRSKKEGIILTWPWPIRTAIYLVIYALLVSMGQWSAGAFLYFQF